MTDKKPKKTGRPIDGGDRPPRRRPAARPTETAADSATKAFEGERIAKVMARAGACSRRDAEDWIVEGRVSVNGKTLSSPAVNVREGDRIEIDGQPLAEREPTRLFLFHKPAGLVTSAKDPEGRETVFGFLDERFPDLPRLVSVGRLDINTEGLLLLTNDGGLARTLELPATGWTRRYRVRAHGEIDQARLDELRKGVSVDGVDYAPIEARLDREQGSNVWLTMGLREGKNREIKRVLEHLGLEVNRLIRISFGPFQLGELAEGVVEEVRLKTLREQLGKGLADLAGVDFSSPMRVSAEPEHVAAEEARKRGETRKRKHVTTLRAERDERRDAGPRARIERSATADRKGRAVTVEKIVAARAAARPIAEESADTRNARRFRAERAQDRVPGERRAPPRRDGEDRPPRRAAAGPRKPFEKSGSRPFERRDEAGSDFRKARPPRREGDERPPRREGSGPRKPFEKSGGRPFERRDEAGSDFRKARPPRREGDERPPRREGSGPRKPFEKSGGRPFERREEPGSDFRKARPPRRDGDERPPRRDDKPRGRPPTGDARSKFARGGKGGAPGGGYKGGAPKGGGRKPGGGGPRKPR
jgi:23S rRNA pseudouridine2605 synthase